MDDDERRAFARAVFESVEEVPPDVVPYPERTREERRADLLEANEREGTWVEVTIPGEVIEDADGNPVGMTPARTQCVNRSTVVTTRDLEEAGLTREDVPRLKVVAPYRREQS